MANENDDPNRRTVLRTVAGVLVGATTATGLASARLEPMDCAETVVDSPAYGEACPVDGYVGQVPVGVYGQVTDTCTDSNGHRWVYFRSAEMYPPSAWIYEGNLMEQPCS